MEKSTMKRNTEKRNRQGKSATAILQFEILLGLIYRLNRILQVLFITKFTYCRSLKKSVIQGSSFVIKMCFAMLERH